MGSEVPNKLAQPRSLILVCDIHLQSQLSQTEYNIDGQQMPYWECIYARSDLALCCLHIPCKPFCQFLLRGILVGKVAGFCSCHFMNEDSKVTTSLYEVEGHCGNTTEPQRKTTNPLTCAPNEVSDQPAHSRSLIRVFVVHMKKLCTLGYPEFAQGRF